MEYQVQGSVLIDGEWVSRSADVYRIMARSQQQEDTEMREPELQPRTEVPNLGILSKTVIASPFSKFVLPANIRHKDLNDVVLVSEDSVHLKEICDYGHLRHVATKADFKGRILAARVFGEPRKVEVNVSGQEPLRHRTSMHRGRRSATGEEAIDLPPEVIVLTLTTRTLMFLWARQSQTETVTFCQKSVRLPAAGPSHIGWPGNFLAIDPDCRAIAVAAPEGSFMLYKTKPMDAWRDETRAGHDGLPIVDEALIHIDGRIIHMEFLSSGGGRDDSHVVLLFVLVHDGKTKLACYDWDFRYDLNDTSARKERSVLGFEDRDPSLLVPLSRSPDFLLVSDQHISLHRRVLSGPTDRYETEIAPHILAPLRPGENKSTPRWVQWARAPRNPQWGKEAFYLAREDGVVIYAEQRPGDNVHISEVGNLHYPIDTAFACLAVDNSEFSQAYPDVLVAGGAGSDGHLCKVGAWPQEYSYTLSFAASNAPTFIESIPNWTPLSDMSVTLLAGLQQPHERDRAGVFVANGRAPNGEVSELRKGIKALVDDSFSGTKGSTGLWIVDSGSNTLEDDGGDTKEHYATFIIALPPESMLIRVSRNQLEDVSQGRFWSAWEHGVWDKVQLPSGEDPVQDDLVRDEETISACAWSDQFSIQITRRQAKILRRPALNAVDSASFPNSLLRAGVRPGCPFIAVAFREDGKTVLHVGRVLGDGTFDYATGHSLRRELPCDPTCLELLDFAGVPHVFVGTIDSGICLFRIDTAGELFPVYDIHLESNPSSGLRMVCESAVLLSSREQRVIACGTRNGFLVCMALEATDERYVLLSSQLAKMGNTAVYVRHSATDPSTAFVACGPDFCRLRCASSDSCTIDIDSIWLSDQRKPAYAQSAITALDQLPLATGLGHSGRDLGGFLFAVSGDEVVFAQLDYDVRWSSHGIPPLAPEQGKTVPRKLLTSATPTKLAYMGKGLQKMAVATIETKEARGPPDGYRIMYSSIKLLKLHHEPSEEHDIKQEDGTAASASTPPTAEIALHHYERVHSMVEWTYANERNKYHFIVVGTGITEGPGKEKGRRLFLQVTKSGIKLQKEKTFDDPVRCLAVFDDKRIVSILGKTLSMDEFNVAAGRWEKTGTKDLSSFGVHLTVSPPFVYVSTAHDSHICYEVCTVHGHPRWRAEFVQVFTDSRQRSSVHHLVLDLPNREFQPYRPAPSKEPENLAEADTIVLQTDKNCSVTGFFHPLETLNKFTAETLFDASLPRSVIRIHKGDIRPPWRRPCKSPTEPFVGTPGVLADDIVGACTDGTIYSFSILSAPARRLLRLIQKLIETKQERDPTRQFTTVKETSADIFRILQNGAGGSQDGEIKARDVDPMEMERGEAAPRFKHVDGDLLTRWLDEGGHLVDLVSDGCEPAVKRLFLELARMVSIQETLFRSEEDVFAWARRWIGEVLMPLL